MNKNLFRALGTVSGFTFLSRILGFVRDMVIAQVFGASTATDAFLVAFKIPNFMRRLFAEGAFSQAFVPVLGEYKETREQHYVKHLIDHVSGALAGILTLLTVLGIFAAPLLVLIFAPGFAQMPEKYALATDLLRITLPYMLFISLTAFAGGILNTYGRFAVPAVTPVLLNLCMIAAALWFTAWFERPVLALAWGVFVAGVVQLLFQIPFLYRLGLLPKFAWQWPLHSGVRKVLRLMLPAIFAVSVTQISLLIDTLMASFLVTGSITWLYYSDRMLEFPVGVFGVALATVLLPRLSQLSAKKSEVAYQHSLNWGLRWVFLIGLPSMLGLMLLSGPILTTLFYHGAFRAEDVTMSSYSLIAYSVGLLGFVLIKILASGFFSRQDTKTPMRIAVIAMLVNITLNFMLIWSLAHIGLALATALSALLNAALLYRALSEQKLFIPESGWIRFFSQLVFASLGMSALLWWGVGSFSDWLIQPLGWRIWHLFGWIGAGVVCYFTLLWLAGLRPAHMRLRH
ncbi:murein biosynthesis integral membrane protein MurJ [Candidatus Venteria ishoeyi]|uniref:murein biosynthesis integral membrane protein MurJ n=1 Tax=Candidatus Venteria ishoeyi TaxID=1899563 RepID=UPI0025A5D0A1|nr:murein biosynthesis integral membrane protein MurJ [Candidatus Venteria ishoeyi]MDM8544962.1 murein biosynthesis integral membrane protein MurJ [Candidatus Venteria ishoeyi]